MLTETKLLSLCRDDPDLFHTVILGRAPYWWRQVEVAHAVAHGRDTVVYSGNAVGKDYLVAGLILWWLWTRKNAQVIVIGPSQSQLAAIVWKELRRAFQRARLPLGGQISQGLHVSPLTLTLANGWQALAFSTNSLERASGHHAPAQLIVGEEASGLDPFIWEAIDSFKYTKLLAIGNPTRAEGRFV